ncbi:MAG: LuxR C-terminal-related transcriptional regulator [Myxococcales bacterium]|nr:LuxR C-terminal-related transcriptional regulator [Myxococcales bacterium]
MREHIQLAAESYGPTSSLDGLTGVREWLAHPSPLTGVVVGSAVRDGCLAGVVQAVRSHHDVPVLVVVRASNGALLREAFRLDADLLQEPIEAGDLTLFFERALQSTHRAFRQQEACVARFGDRHHLTPRHRELLLAIIAGQRRSDLAASLHISQSTLKWHVNTLLRKCGAKSLVEAACLALRCDGPP